MRTERAQSNGGWRCRQPPLSRAFLRPPARGESRSAWADRHLLPVLRRQWPPIGFPQRHCCLRGPLAGPRRTLLPGKFPFAVPSPEARVPPDGSGKWERHRLAPVPHASSSARPAVASFHEPTFLRTSAASSGGAAASRSFRCRLEPLGHGLKLSCLPESNKRIRPVDNEDNGDCFAAGPGKRLERVKGIEPSTSTMAT